MNSNSNSRTSRNILVLILLVILGAVFTVYYLALKGNQNQVYNDIVVEYTSMFAGNKTPERKLIYILCFGGIVLYSIYYFLNKSIDNDGEQATLELLSENQREKEFLCVLVAMIVVGLMIFGSAYQIIVDGVAFVIFIYIIDKTLIVSGVCVYFMSIYTYIAIYRSYVFLGGEGVGNNMIALICAIILSSIPFLFKNRKKAILRLGLLESVVIPFSLLIYTANRYKQGETVIIIDVSNAMLDIIWLIIIWFMLEAVFFAVKKWKSIDSIENVINFGTCATIIAFNRFGGTGAIMSEDLHHPFENIIGYSQIVELGQIPFKEYIPVSGMYSFVQGAVFKWFGDGGTFANYYATENLFYLFIIIIIVCLLRKHVDNVYVFLISLLLYVDSYNRVVFILPIMLLLTWSKLIEKENAWLMAWFLTSLFHGLYYPLYGVATCIAFVPLAICIIKDYIKLGKLKKDIKTIRFWFGWVGCLLLTFLCRNFLIGTLKHMLAMSGQSILADGISRFGQTLPEWFFGYLDRYLVIRLSLYYIFTFMMPVLVVWVSYALAVKCAVICRENNRIKIKNSKTASIVISIAIMSMIAYSYTVIRYDIDRIYARCASILFISCVLVLIFVWNYIKNTKIRLLVVVIAVSIPTVVKGIGLFSTELNSQYVNVFLTGSNSKLQSYYVVPDNYLYVSDDSVEKLGTGFINPETYKLIKDTSVKFQREEKTHSYMGDPPYFGYYYLLSIKGNGSIEIGATVKGYSAAKEAVDIVKKNKAIVGGNFIPFSNYYFYHWLLASGEYYWDDERWEFIPNENKYSREEILEQNKNNGIASWNMNLEKTASSWGESMESLETLFDEPELKYAIKEEQKEVLVDFEDLLDGNDADFMYLELANENENYNYTLYNLDGEIQQAEGKYSKLLMKKNYNPGMIVQIRWEDEAGEEHAMHCKMSKGKLLLPLGAGGKWLFNAHRSLSIQILCDGVAVKIPDILKIRFLKIREVK